MSILKRFLNLFKSRSKDGEVSGNSEPQEIIEKTELIDISLDISKSEVEPKEEPVEIESSEYEKQKVLPKDQICESKIEISGEKEDLEIVIGFDFGTSCSKVVLRDVPRIISYAVDFGEYGHKNNTLLLPTLVCLNKKNEFDLKKGCIRFSDIKINLIDNPDGEITSEVTNVYIAIAYVGCAFRLIRNWFHDVKGKIYSDYDIIWQINIGIPARDYSNSKLVELFRYVALLGWEVSMGTESISIERIKYFTTQVPNINEAKATILSIHPEDIYAIPEIIAAIVGYAKSRMRKDGMYFLMDIGASTVDISMFNLFSKNGEIKYSILWADLGRFGVLSQLKLRLNSLPEEIKSNIVNKLNLIHCVDPIPDIYPFLPKQYGDIIRKTDLQMSSKLRNLISNVIVKVKKDQNPNDSSWETGVPIFITGGGSEIDYYRELLLNRFSQLSNMNINTPKIVDLPDLEDLEIKDLAPDVIRRFSSAYGLSYRESDIGIIIDAGSIDAISKFEFVVDYSDRYIDKSLI